MTAKLPDLPDIRPGDASEPVYKFLTAVRETLQVRGRTRGDPREWMVLRGELIDVGLLKPGSTGAPIYGTVVDPGIAVGDSVGGEPDPSAEPTPISGLAVTTLFSGAFLEWDAPTYTQGGGNSLTLVYEAVYSGSGPLPTFSNAILIGSAPGSSNVFIAAGRIGTQRHYWVKAVTAAGNEQDSPTGGLNGVSVTIGKINGATHVEALTITTALIANLAVDNSKIANVSAGKLTAGSIAVGDYIQSTGYVAGTSGWRIHGNGTAEFGAASIRGQLTAAQISVTSLSSLSADLGTITAGNITLDTAGYVRAGQTAYDTGTGFWLGYSGGAYRFSIGSSTKALLWDGSNLTVRGAVVGNANLSGGITYDKLSITALSAITADMGTITAGTITLNTSGHIKGGQTAYDTGTGFFLGYSGAAYKFSIGSASGAKMTWDGTDLRLSGQVFGAMSISGVTDIGGSIAAGSNKLLGTRTASVSGGTGTITYQWYLSWSRNTPSSLQLYLTGARTASCSVYALSAAAADETDAELVCVATDANGRTAVAACDVGVVFT